MLLLASLKLFPSLSKNRPQTDPDILLMLPKRSELSYSVKITMSYSVNSEGDRPMSHREMERFLSDAFEQEFSDSENPYVQLEVPKSAFGRRIREFNLVNKGFTDIEPFLLGAFDLYQSQILEAVRQFDMIKTLSYSQNKIDNVFVYLFVFSALRMCGVRVCIK